MHNGTLHSLKHAAVSAYRIPIWLKTSANLYSILMTVIQCNQLCYRFENATEMKAKTGMKRSKKYGIHFSTRISERVSVDWCELICMNNKGNPPIPHKTYEKDFYTPHHIWLGMYCDCVEITQRTPVGKWVICRWAQFALTKSAKNTPSRTYLCIHPIFALPSKCFLGLNT